MLRWERERETDGQKAKEKDGKRKTEMGERGERNKQASRWCDDEEGGDSREAVSEE